MTVAFQLMDPIIFYPLKLGQRIKYILIELRNRRLDFFTAWNSIGFNYVANKFPDVRTQRQNRQTILWSIEAIIYGALYSFREIVDGHRVGLKLIDVLNVFNIVLYLILNEKQVGLTKVPGSETVVICLDFIND